MEVTKDMVQNWKDQYGFIYKVNLDGKDFYFKTLSRSDYMTIQATLAVEGASFDNELAVVCACVLEPKLSEDELKSKAGLVSVLAEKIMLRSGFQQVEEEEL